MSVRGWRFWTLGLSASGVSLLSRDARACGGHFYGEPGTPTQSASVATDHRMAVAVTPTMITLWDQIEFAGDPAEFAWVLPVRGAAVVGLGDDDFLQALDQQTQLEIRAPYRRCVRPSADGCVGGGAAGCGAQESASDPGVGPQEDSGVTVKGRSTIGPYATVQVRGSDPGAIVGWLRANKYLVPPDVEPLLGQYVTAGFDFVAVRLRNGASLRAMTPIRVSWKDARVTLPLRMARAGGGEKVGISLFVIADRRFAPKNYATFSVDPAGLAWDFVAGRSDYTSQRDAAAKAYDGRAFALESSVEVSAASVLAAIDEPPRDAGDEPDTATADGRVEDAAKDVVEPDAALGDAGAPPAIDPSASDVEVAFGTFARRRVTRLRGELPARALDEDLELAPDGEQAIVDRTIQVLRASTAPVCPAYATIARSVESSDPPVRLGVLLGAAALTAIAARRASRRG
jgi:hypothetical protein